MTRSLGYDGEFGASLWGEWNVRVSSRAVTTLVKFSLGESWKKVSGEVSYIFEAILDYRKR